MKFYGYGDYLMHHGIKGQKWGIRRFQNEDGSLTLAGKERYGGSFNKTMRAVAKRSSNSYTAIEREQADITEVKKRGGLTDSEAEECIRLADKLYKRAAKNEPAITKDITEIAGRLGSGMYGLEHRLKQPTSLAGKIGSDAKSDIIRFEDAAKGINDTIRYTMISPSRSFSSNYNGTRRALIRKGYSELKTKNYYNLYYEGKVKHKALQSIFRSPGGQTFEVQFHTPSSQAAKELKLPLYNERRRSGNTAERNAELERQMVELAERVTNPRGVFKIKSR